MQELEMGCFTASRTGPSGLVLKAGGRCLYRLGG